MKIYDVRLDSIPYFTIFSEECPLPNIENGNVRKSKISAANEVNSMSFSYYAANYSCNCGYQLVDGDERKCDPKSPLTMLDSSKRVQRVPKNKWTGKAPICKAKSKMSPMKCN